MYLRIILPLRVINSFKPKLKAMTLQFRKRVALPFPYNQNFIIRKLHPCKVVDVMEHLAMRIDMEMGMVLKSKLFLLEYISVDFNLGFIFAQQF